MLWVLQSLCFVTDDGDVGRIYPSDASLGAAPTPLIPASTPNLTWEAAPPPWPGLCNMGMSRGNCPERVCLRSLQKSQINPKSRLGSCSPTLAWLGDVQSIPEGINP